MGHPTAALSKLRTPVLSTSETRKEKKRGTMEA